MVTRRSVTIAVGLGSLVLSSCSPNAQETSATDSDVSSSQASTVVPVSADADLDEAPSSTATPSGPDGPGSVASTAISAGSTPESTAPGTTTPSTDEAQRPGVVERAGSVEAVLAELPEATNFAAGVAGWLSSVPGQEGVLRNSRGITVFVPVDDGFPTDVRDLAFADPGVAAITISEHLHVGVLDELDASVTTASGSEHAVTDGPTVGGRRVIRTEAATNGIVYLIDGPLTAG